MLKHEIDRDSRDQLERRDEIAAMFAERAE
jgi:hypothetical protein